MIPAVANELSERTDWFVVSGSSGEIDATGIPLSAALAMQLSKASPTITVRAGLFTENHFFQTVEPGGLGIRERPVKQSQRVDSFVLEKTSLRHCPKALIIARHDL